MRLVNRLSPIVFAVTALVLPSAAHAYCRTTVCANPNKKTRPAECDIASNYDEVTRCYANVTPLYWEQNCFSFSAQADGSKKYGITAKQLEEITQACFDQWQNVSCPSGGNPNIHVEAFPEVKCTESGYNKSAPNQNVLVFHDDEWPDEATASSVIALTGVHFHPSKGVIYDVDLEFNSANFAFSLDGSGHGMDLQSVIQHESGHFLGLADLYNQSSVTPTMYWDYGSNPNLEMRTLEADDIAGVCAVFPPAAAAGATCDATPRHGFSIECSEPSDNGCGCRLVGYGSSRTSYRGLLAGLGIAVLVAARRHRKASGSVPINAV